MNVYKGYQIKADKKAPTNVIIVTDGKGGKIPQVLEGLFTSPNFARGAIDAYLASKPTKGVKINDEAIPEG